MNLKTMTLIVLMLSVQAAAGAGLIVVKVTKRVWDRRDDGLIDYQEVTFVMIQAIEPEETFMAKRLVRIRVPILAKVDTSNPNWCHDVLPPMYSESFPPPVFDLLAFLNTDDVVVIRNWYRAHCNQWAKEVGLDFVRELYARKDRIGR